MLDIPLDHPPLIVDSFAGGGGASTGIEMALGRSPDIAINHNPAALALHAANHPHTLHLSENVYQVDPLDYLARRHIGLAWFSPDCKHFSKAKGGKPVERNIRDLAWIVPGWVERIQKSGGTVDVVILENVEEFRDWGPLVETDRGLMPDPERRGQTFEKWCRIIRRLGGKIEWRELRACDFGAPTIRKRLFIIIRFDGQKIVWPKPTHCPPERLLQDGYGSPDDPSYLPTPITKATRKDKGPDYSGAKKPWRVAAEIIDWSLPCPSIFDTTAEVFDKHGLRAVRPLASATMSRVARGVKRYVLDAQKPFLVRTDMASAAGRNGVQDVDAPFLQSYYGTGDGQRMDEPQRTVTTKDRFGFVEGEIGWPPFTEAQALRARQVADLLRAHGFWDDREFVTVEIGEETFTIVDIGMRMLTPRELFSAQGFAPDYIIELEHNGRPLPKSDQIACCGNSVSPPMARALVAANCGHLAEWREAAE